MGRELLVGVLAIGAGVFTVAAATAIIFSL